ncbi:reverse transcriptase domain-containing protein [Actinomadura madurae]|nr:reverse transcriptase domain-containing protein [Actinomadura madurae]
MSIPSVRDRIVQAAAKIVLEPIFEADMADCSFGFGPERSPHDALQVLIDESWRGRRWVVETDIANCFEAIAHSGLMEAIEERVCDRAVLNLVRGMLRAGVMDGGSLRRSVTGGASRRGDLPVAVQRLPAPAGPGMVDRTARRAGALRRRRGGDVPDSAAGQDRVGAADWAAGRPGA